MKKKETVIPIINNSGIKFGHDYIPNTDEETSFTIILKLNEKFLDTNTFVLIKSSPFTPIDLNPFIFVNLIPVILSLLEEKISVSFKKDDYYKIHDTLFKFNNDI